MRVGGASVKTPKAKQAEVWLFSFTAFSNLMGMSDVYGALETKFGLRNEMKNLRNTRALCHPATLSNFNVFGEKVGVLLLPRFSKHFIFILCFLFYLLISLTVINENK